jgi:uncharacterized protein YcaQ
LDVYELLEALGAALPRREGQLRHHPGRALQQISRKFAMPRLKAALSSPPVVSAVDARRLLLHSQALFDDPGNSPPATARDVCRLIERMGFVQVDTISTVDRAHHLILAARMNGYRPALLTRGLERDCRLFEHWTHDASIIPLKWYPHWRPRFERYRSSTWHRRNLGEEADQIVAAVLERIAREGPLSSRDFEHTGEKKQNSWWGWKPPKIALDYLWRTGVLHVVARRNFHKVYDLSERVLPEHALGAAPMDEDHVDWACRTALERLGTATVREIAQFWAAVPMTKVAAWLKAATTAGAVTQVMIESSDGSPPRPAFALRDIAARIADLPDPPAGMRLLCPFDPVLRDRARTKRLFNFDFRFEGFVPAAKRVHGYYVMAILEGDRFVGKVDPKFDRAAGTLRIGKTWWEPGMKLTRDRKVALRRAAEDLAGWIGATDVEFDG